MIRRKHGQQLFRIQTRRTKARLYFPGNIRRICEVITKKNNIGCLTIERVPLLKNIAVHLAGIFHLQQGSGSILGYSRKKHI